MRTLCILQAFKKWANNFVTIRACSVLDPPLLPLRFRSARVHAAQASVCWRAQSTADSLFFIDVPTNPGPRSFCARPVPGTAGAGPQPILSIALKGAPSCPRFTNPYSISRDLDPGMSSSDITLFHVSSSSSRHAPART